MSLDDARRRLKDRYVDGLASRRDALELLLAALYEDPESAESALRHEAMEIRRSAHDYGFQRVSDAAGRVESAQVGSLDEHTRVLLQALDQVTARETPTPPPVLHVLDPEELRTHHALVVRTASRRGSPLSVLWIGVSDSVAIRIRKALRETDVVGRLEVGVIVLLPFTNLEGAQLLLQRLENTGRVRRLATPTLVGPGESLDDVLGRLR